MNKSIINSLPKSGTNLLVKTLDFVVCTQSVSLIAPLVLQNTLGDKGGGSTASHEACLHRLFDHLSFPHGKVGDVVKNLFGEGRHTFRQGRIESWKEEIPSALFADINYELGDVIERWGYAL